MPDLDQIKQGEQGARDRRARFARGRSGNPTDGVVGAGFEKLRWPLPVRLGDELRAESEVLEVRPSESRPQHGLIKVRSTVNQNGEAVRVLVSNLIVPRRDR
jgi:acyl dehydratase